MQCALNIEVLLIIIFCEVQSQRGSGEERPFA